MTYIIDILVITAVVYAAWNEDKLVILEDKIICWFRNRK